jgi:hypothetical protein
MIKKTARVGGICTQDEFRRADMLRMSPADRVRALVEMRNRAAPCEELKRVVSVRRLR